MTEHDYRFQAWGHACSVSRWGAPQENHFKGHIFGKGIEVGDTILLKMSSGMIGILQLDELNRPGDPFDLYFIESAHFIGYK